MCSVDGPWYRFLRFQSLGFLLQSISGPLVNELFGSCNDVVEVTTLQLEWGPLESLKGGNMHAKLGPSEAA